MEITATSEQAATFQENGFLRIDHITTQDEVESQVLAYTQVHWTRPVPVAARRSAESGTMPRRLADGDQIRLGSVVITFRVPQPPGATETSPGPGGATTGRS